LNPTSLVIHGHFYQPPRENPWPEVVEPEPSAAPFHDWNERIYQECYRANGNARIVSSRGQVESITNNYLHLSFNFGPTLLSWMEDNAGDTLQGIAQALWGDASLWYKLAEANGLSANSALTAGQALAVPLTGPSNRSNADMARPYDPQSAVGDLNPTSAKPPKKGKCGVFGQILLTVINDKKGGGPLGPPLRFSAVIPLRSGCRASARPDDDRNRPRSSSSDIRHRHRPFRRCCTDRQRRRGIRQGCRCPGLRDEDGHWYSHP